MFCCVILTSVQTFDLDLSQTERVFLSTVLTGMNCCCKPIAKPECANAPMRDVESVTIADNDVIYH